MSLLGFSTGMAFGGVLMLLLILLIFFLIISTAVFWILMLIDVLRRDFPKGRENEKILWALIIIFAGVIGATIYYFVVKKS